MTTKHKDISLDNKDKEFKRTIFHCVEDDVWINLEIPKNNLTSNPININTTENPIGRFMVAVGAVIESANTGKILVCKRSKNLDFQPNEWEITYGRLAQFEEPEQGLRREVKEELGLKDLKVERILSIWHIYRGEEKGENELIGITYYCSTSSNAIKLSEEHDEFRWIKPEEALELIEVEGIKRDIQKFINLKIKII